METTVFIRYKDWTFLVVELRRIARPSLTILNHDIIFSEEIGVEFLLYTFHLQNWRNDFFLEKIWFSLRTPRIINYNHLSEIFRLFQRMLTLFAIQNQCSFTITSIKYRLKVKNRDTRLLLKKDSCISTYTSLKRL